MSFANRFKKRKLDLDGDNGGGGQPFNQMTKFQPTGGRSWTVSVAIPTSVIADCATPEQRINSPSRIARALAMFSVDEVVIFDDRPAETRHSDVDEDAYTGDMDPGHYIFHLLSYMETPPFMRKALFPLHPNLRLQGLLPVLEMPHHPHRDDAQQLPYLEGMTVEGKPEPGHKTLVDIGLRKPVSIKEAIPPKTRVTLHFPQHPSLAGGEPVDPALPRSQAGYYWGYQVRRCASLSAVFTESPFEDGYDVSIGTSERGLPASQVFPRAAPPLDFRHLVIVLGGPRGLEYAAMNDAELASVGISRANVREAFDHWVDILPSQGSRSIRTDEAVFLALMELRRLWSDV